MFLEAGMIVAIVFIVVLSIAVIVLGIYAIREYIKTKYNKGD